MAMVVADVLSCNKRKNERSQNILFYSFSPLRRFSASLRVEICGPTSFFKPRLGPFIQKTIRK